jgi:predicted flavoprotein YhiN
MVLVEGTMGWEHAQVTSGGVAVYEVDPLTMESRLVPGVYITGELLDVDGPCGGYNLHWAWATGILAGRSAAAKRPRPVKKRP